MELAMKLLTLFGLAGLLVLGYGLSLDLVRAIRQVRQKAEAAAPTISPAPGNAVVVFCCECNAPLVVSLLVSAADGDGLDEYHATCPHCFHGTLLQIGTADAVQTQYPSGEAVCPRI